MIGILRLIFLVRLLILTIILSTTRCFSHLENIWGPHSVDRFACSYNAKLTRFNSRFVQDGPRAVDAFTRDWSPENNWLVPPIALVSMVLRHMSDRKAMGTLVVPLWKSAYFWPLLSNDGTHLNSFLCYWLYRPNRTDLFVKGKTKNKLQSKTFVSCSGNIIKVKKFYKLGAER